MFKSPKQTTTMFGGSTVNRFHSCKLEHFVFPETQRSRNLLQIWGKTRNIQATCTRFYSRWNQTFCSLFISIFRYSNQVNAWNKETTKWYSFCLMNTDKNTKNEQIFIIKEHRVKLSEDIKWKPNFLYKTHFNTFAVWKSCTADFGLILSDLSDFKCSSKVQNQKPKIRTGVGWENWSITTRTDLFMGKKIRLPPDLMTHSEVLTRFNSTEHKPQLRF